MTKTLPSLALALILTGCAGLGKPREAPPYEASKSLALNIALAAGITTPDGKLKDWPRAEWERVKDQPAPPPKPREDSGSLLFSLLRVGTMAGLGAWNPAPGFSPVGAAAMNSAVVIDNVSRDGKVAPEDVTHLVVWTPATGTPDEVQAKIKAVVEEAWLKSSGLTLQPAEEWHVALIGVKDTHPILIQPGCPGSVTKSIATSFAYDRKCSGGVAAKVGPVQKTDRAWLFQGPAYGPIDVQYETGGLLAAPNDPDELYERLKGFSRVLPEHYYLYVPRLKAVPVLLHRGERLEFAL